MQNHDILLEMIRVYETYHCDWMGYKIRKNNPLTYHHIIERRDGGEESFENGALLTKSAHYLLNKAERYDPELYSDYNYWFKIINQMNCPLCDEMKEIIKELNKRLKVVIINNVKCQKDATKKREKNAKKLKKIQQRENVYNNI